MNIKLHALARTTPAIRREIALSDEPAAVLAERYGVSLMTVYKWKRREDFLDRSHTPHRLRTTMTPAQEAIAVELRKTLLLPLDDLLSVMREFVCPDVSRSGLDRCLRRHGVGSLRSLKPQVPKPAHQPFAAYEPGFIHIDVKYLPQMADETRRRYLFVAIDRATRWVFIALYASKSARNARAFLKSLLTACPIKINKILTDNGKEFTARLLGQPSATHAFESLCEALGIEHRTTRVRRPQTNGMVERFNGRIEEVLRSHHFISGEDLEKTLLRYAWLYNHQLPQAALKGLTPMQAMKQWYTSHPHLFQKRPYDHPGCDSYAKRATTISRRP
ncbi:IS481 family transposase [Tepidimonas taiwanensis]|uniref:IS481 family transposase n=3 Tax=Tepidimonas taiwanensis TaxID=307486 RepID=UPI001CC900D6|nr:IS481 family transposase [Tepidimonas taiwanensis]UBQ05886.1 IS481 family transposase [Tepidimonas taiwanensis]